MDLSYVYLWLYNGSSFFLLNSSAITKMGRGRNKRGRERIKSNWKGKGKEEVERSNTKERRYDEGKKCCIIMLQTHAYKGDHYQNSVMIRKQASTEKKNHLKI